MRRAIKNNFQVLAQQRLGEVAKSLQLDPYPLRKSGRGVEYKNHLSRTIFTVYDDGNALDPENAEGIEVAFSPDNVEGYYGIDATDVSAWIDRISPVLGHFARPKTKWKYPRIGLWSTSEVEAFTREIRTFLKANERNAKRSHLGQEPPPVIDEKTSAQIWARRGQAEFRGELLVAYEGRCAVTGCSDVDVLEAAHITPYHEEQTYGTENGILLRADIHTLFDLFLVSIDPRDGKVVVADRLSDFYQELEGREVTLPASESARPAPHRLMEHFMNWQSLNV